jgi:hypothetical protein
MTIVSKENAILKKSVVKITMLVPLIIVVLPLDATTPPRTVTITMLVLKTLVIHTTVAIISKLHVMMTMLAL